MCIFLGLGYTKLLIAFCAHDSAEGVFNGFGRECDGYIKVFVILRRADEAQRVHGLFAHKAVKVRQVERPCDLSCTVGTEVHENDAVALIHRTVTAADNGLDKLVTDIGGVAFLDRLDGVGLKFTFAADDGVIRLFHSVPALVTIHCVKSALQGSNSCVAELFALIGKLLYIARSASGRHITAVKEAVDIDLIQTTALCHVQSRKNVAYMTVHTAVGQQSHDVQRLTVLLCCIHGAYIRRVFKEFTVLYGLRYLRQILRVADLGVAHLPLRQSHIKAGGGKLRVRILGKEHVEIGRFRNGYCIVLRGGCNSEAVHYNQYRFTHFLPP